MKPKKCDFSEKHVQSGVNWLFAGDSRFKVKLSETWPLRGMEKPPFLGHFWGRQKAKVLIFSARALGALAKCLSYVLAARSGH